MQYSGAMNNLSLALSAKARKAIRISNPQKWVADLFYVKFTIKNCIFAITNLKLKT